MIHLFFSRTLPHIQRLAGKFLIGNVFVVLVLSVSVIFPHIIWAQDAVTFQIDMRQQIQDSLFFPKRHVVGVRGNMSPLRWDSTLVASDPDGDGVYSITITMLPPKSPFYEETRIAYKFKAEGDKLFNRGWETSDNSTLNLTGSPQTVRRFFSVQQKTPAFSTKSSRVKQHNFTSRILRARPLYVLLPKDYATSNQRYPVLYMHDGQNMFDDSTAANGEWHMDEVASGLMDSASIPQMIIVGVGTFGDTRIPEYTPTAITRQTTTGGTISIGGSGALHARMLVEEIKPFIDSTYRTLQDRNSTALGGSSLGGLMTIFTGAKYPDVFGKLLVISPSVWWDEKSILKTVQSESKTMLKTPQDRQKIWLDVGTQEGKEALDGARALNKLLVKQGWKKGKTMQYQEFPNAAHSESAWAARLEPMLKFMFEQK